MSTDASGGRDADYVLGTHGAELERLGLQHRVWRDAALTAWRRAGVSAGHAVIDAGAGPGFATLDLADIVGPAGRVVAIERSGRFMQHLRGEAARRGLRQIEIVAGDLADGDVWAAGAADSVWCRWVLAFVSDPARIVANMARALRPGGAVILQEYSHYRTWRLAPPDPAHDRFVESVMAAWHASGGEPDVGIQLPLFLEQCGLVVEHAEVQHFALAPADPMWTWLARFVAVNVERQVELGELTRVEADAAVRVIAERARDPHSIMLTPSVVQLIGRKPR